MRFSVPYASYAILAGVVTVVINGSIVSGGLPARIVGGRVVVPLNPVVVRLVARAGYEPNKGIVTIERPGVRIVVPVVLVEDATPYVELAPIVRELGGDAGFDTATKTLTISVNAADAITTPPPFVPGRSDSPAPPPASPTPAVTPRSPEPGSPHPRRTAIPAVPSQPRQPDAPSGGAV